MTESAELSEAKRRTANHFDLISDGYDGLRFVRRVADRFLELAAPRSGERILDVATGTGLIAIPVARAVAPEGAVIGVDIARDMLEQARRKAAAAGVTNIEFREGDAERLDFPDGGFDGVLCSLAIFFLPDMLGALREWRRVLRPGGRVLFSAFGPGLGEPMNRMFGETIQRYGITWQRASPRTNSPEACRDLLRGAGFEHVAVATEQLGYHLANTDEWWDQVWRGNQRSALAQLSAEQFARFRAEHLAEVEGLVTERGLWVDVPATFAAARRPL